MAHRRNKPSFAASSPDELYKESQELVEFCWFNQSQRPHIFYSTREQRTGFFPLLSFILEFNNINT